MYKLTGRISCTVRLEPKATGVPLVGKPMLTNCAKHVVVKVASNAAIVNFMVVAIRGSLELVGVGFSKLYVSVPIPIYPRSNSEYRFSQVQVYLGDNP